MESELFGYERGAFTGAVTAKPGRFELAHGGTLFLDEIGEMPIHLQAKLLGVLQDRVLERLGGIKPITIDVRIIAATNKDLGEACKAGAFRQDLFYRLNVVPLRIPPLRERMEDLPPLISFLLGKLSSKCRKNISAIAPDVMVAFCSYTWPGNIRELENIIERMIVMSDDTDTLVPSLLPSEIRGRTSSNGTATFRERVESVSRTAEKDLILDALEKSGQNRTKAAEFLGISRRTLQYKIRQYGL
jgi:two-component system NtrC family response regulator